MGNHFYTGDNFATNQSSLVAINDEKSSIGGIGSSLDLPLELGYGVVKKIISDDSSGQLVTSINVVLNKRNNRNDTFTDASDPVNAFPLSKDAIKIPIINESVLCISIGGQWYYFSDINSLDGTNNNLDNESTYDRKGTYYGETFNPISIPNMRLFEGDTLVQGRFGNKIRFGSTNVSKSRPTPPTPNDWSGGGTSGSPITIISNGGGDLENLDEDPSSIYLTSDQSLPIYLQSPTPKALTSLEQYSGTSQVVIASDKLVFYTKDGIGDIIISSLGTAYLMGKKVHLSTNEWSNVDVTALMDIIEGLVDQLKALTSAEAQFATGVGPTGPATNAGQVIKLKTDLALLKG